MSTNPELFVVDKRALPDIFAKVTKVKMLMDSGSVTTVRDAVKIVGISRSTFYKYKDYVTVLGENKRGRIMTLALNLSDSPGLLSNVLNIVAGDAVNILTINQTIPINSVANVTMTLDIGEQSVDIIDELIEKLKQIDGVLSLKIIARE